MTSLIHAGCVVWQDAGILITGASGSGKSDFALRLLDAGGELVSDDQTLVKAQDGALFASAPPGLHGKLEVRGMGIVPWPATEQACLDLALQLCPCDAIERLPEPSVWSCEGINIPLLALDPSAPSAIARLRLFLQLQREEKTTLISAA